MRDRKREREREREKVGEREEVEKRNFKNVKGRKWLRPERERDEREREIK